MCNISEGVLEKSWNNALRVGEERGEKRGEKRGVLNSILNLMKNASLTFDQSATMLGITANEREEYRKLVDKQLAEFDLR